MLACVFIYISVHLRMWVAYPRGHMCASSHVCPSENRWVFSIFLNTLPLTLQGGSITTCSKHPVFGTQAQEVSVYCYWACVSLDHGGASPKEECKPNFMFPHFWLQFKQVSEREARELASTTFLSFFFPSQSHKGRLSNTHANEHSSDPNKPEG